MYMYGGWEATGTYKNGNIDEARCDRSGIEIIAAGEKAKKSESPTNAEGCMC